MPREHRYYVYSLASISRVLYIGVTNDMARRVQQHREATAGFTARYRVHRLVDIETTDDVRAAIARERQLKGWTRARKIARIENVNPGWDDLAESPSLSS
jgi:putative endonuclease